VKSIRKAHAQERQELLKMMESVGLKTTSTISTSTTGAKASNEEDNDMEVDEDTAVVTPNKKSTATEKTTGAATNNTLNTAVDGTVDQLINGIHSQLEDIAQDILIQYKADELKKELNVLEAERNKLKGNMNMNALLDYWRKDIAYRQRLQELEDLNTQRDLLKTTYESYRQQRLTQFMSGFGIISLRLKEMYQMITLGGDAELELLDSLDPFSEGISFSVRPPKKSWKQIGNLSGGEKTLSSLALVFALHYYKPTPLYVMDEIDAALVRE